MMLWKRLSLWIAVVGFGFSAWAMIAAKETPVMPSPLAEPPRSPYERAVAASGIIEAANENVRIAPPQAGLVTAVHVVVGQHVTQGDPLFQLDDRELRGQLLTRQAAIPPLRAQIDEQQVRIADLDTQLRRLDAVHDRRAVSEDDLKRAWYAVQVAIRAKVRMNAALDEAIAQRDEVQLLLDRLTVRAPRDGTILQVATRAGEFAAPQTSEPLMLLGDTEQFQIRADVDEVNAPWIAPHSQAVASLKSRAESQIPLTFVRIEPYVVPKRSLTGDNSERVDTRVLQIIYRFERPTFPVYTGQQVDVFIQRAGTDEGRTVTPPVASPSPTASAPSEAEAP